MPIMLVAITLSLKLYLVLIRSFDWVLHGSVMKYASLLTNIKCPREIMCHNTGPEFSLCACAVLPASNIRRKNVESSGFAVFDLPCLCCQ